MLRRHEPVFSHTFRYVSTLNTIATHIRSISVEKTDRLTILPSPLPRSTTVPDRCFNAFNIFTIWVGVAGTYGKQILRKPGDRKGMLTSVMPTATPPEIAKNEKKFHH